jgi:hypothetical protein
MPARPPGPRVEIKARENGPYRVEGPIRLIDADGNSMTSAAAAR